MKLLIILMTISLAAAKLDSAVLPFLQGTLTDLTDIKYEADEPGFKHKSPSGEHVPEYSTVHLTPYIDLISGIPATRKQQYQTIIPYKKRMQAQLGMLRSAVQRGKRQPEIFEEKRTVPSNARRLYLKRDVGEKRGVPSNARRLYMKRDVEEKRAVPGNARRLYLKRDVGEKRAFPNAQRMFLPRDIGNKRAVPSNARMFLKRVFGEKRDMPGTARRKFWKRGMGFISIPESKFLGLLGSQFSNEMYGKREKFFPGNKLPINQFKRAGIPRNGAPIRKFNVPSDEELQRVVLFKGLPKIISSVNSRLHDKVFRPLDNMYN